MEEIKAISKPAVTARIFSDTLQEIHTMNVEQYKDICGYHTLFTTRPDLYNLLLSHVNPEKILFGKRVLSIQQDDAGVSVHCADGSDYHGDVLVGCDGAHSSVRQSLYKQLQEEGHLPSADAEDQRVCYMSVLGTTGPMDPKKYPSVTEPHSRGDVITSRTKPHTVKHIPCAICFSFFILPADGFIPFFVEHDEHGRKYFLMTAETHIHRPRRPYLLECGCADGVDCI